MIELALRLRQEREMAANRERRRIHSKITVWSVLGGAVIGPVVLAVADGHVPHAAIFVAAWFCVVAIVVGLISAMLE